MRRSEECGGRWERVAALQAAILAASVFAGLSFGSSGRGPLAVLGAFLPGGGEAGELTRAIVLDIRLPRVLLAGIAGAILSLGGLVFQAVLRNPLAEPYVLGVSGGAGAGAVIGLVLGLPRIPHASAAAFVCAMATLYPVLRSGAGPGRTSKDAMLLTGVMVNTLCASIIMLALSLSPEAGVHGILAWLMGDLSGAEYAHAVFLLGVAAPWAILCGVLARSMNLLALGEETAAHLGVNVRAVSSILLGATSLAVSAVVCVAGLVGFVGLLVPHALRLLAGPDHRRLAWMCLPAGASFLIACDTATRCLPSGLGEMPVGVVTALAGAPAFIFLLKRERR